MGLSQSTTEDEKSVKTLSHPITGQSILKPHKNKSADALEPGGNHLKNIDLEEEEIQKNFSCQKGAKINPEKFNGPAEKPKTANKAFGGISDFLLFFENRNPQMKEFAKHFTSLEYTQNSEFSITQLDSFTTVHPSNGPCANFGHFWKMRVFDQ